MEQIKRSRAQSTSFISRHLNTRLQNEKTWRRTKNADEDPSAQTQETHRTVYLWLLPSGRSPQSLHSWFKVITFHLILECCPRFQILYILPDSCFSHTFIYSSSCRAASRWPWTQTPRTLQRRQESSCEAQRRSSFSNIYLAQPSPTLVKYEHRQALKPAGGVVCFFFWERENMCDLLFIWKIRQGLMLWSLAAVEGTSFSLLNLEIAVS